jgi:hypothetical protein
MKVYQKLATAIDAYHRCVKEGNELWEEKHKETIDAIMDTAPSGSGIDHGTTLDLDASTANKLVFTFGYHHMDEMGGYDGWTEHALRAYPSFVCGVELTISGRDRNDIKDYLYEVYQGWLSEEWEVNYKTSSQNQVSTAE